MNLKTQQPAPKKKLTARDIKGAVNVFSQGGFGNRLLTLKNICTVVDNTRRINVIWDDSKRGYGLAEYEFEDFFKKPPNMYFYNVDSLPWIYKTFTKMYMGRNHKPPFIFRLIAKAYFNLRFSITSEYRYLYKQIRNQTRNKGKQRGDIEYIKKMLNDFDTIWWHSLLMHLSGLPKQPSASMFVLRDELKESTQALAQQIISPTLGVHIRHFEGIGESEKYSSPNFSYQTFANAMQREIDKNKDVKFYIACDNPQTKDKIINKFKDRVVYQPCEVSRDSFAGLQSALVDMYALGETDGIIAIQKSSFAKYASEIKQVPLIFVD